MLPSLEFGVLVEIGSGDGSQADAFADHFDVVYAIDDNGSVPWRASDRVGLFRERGTVPGDHRLAAGQANFLFCENVLEHIPPDTLSSFLEDCRRILRPDGAAWFSWSPVWSPIGAHVGNRHYGWEHVRRSPEGWESFLAEQFGETFRDEWLAHEWRPGLTRREWLRTERDGYLTIEDVMRGLADAGFETVAHNTRTARSRMFLSLPDVDDLLRRASLMNFTCESDTYLLRVARD